MFTVLSIILALILLPFLMSSAMPFHLLPENERNVYKSYKNITSRVEYTVLTVFFVLVTVLWLFPFVSAIFGDLGLITLMLLVILLAIYFVKITISLVKRAPTTFLVSFLLTTPTQKLCILAIIAVVLMAILENLKLIPTGLGLF